MEPKDAEVACKVGDRIRLVAMADDSNALPAGSTGTVVSVTDGLVGQIGVDWDNGRSLFLIPGMDKYEITNDDDLVGEESACPKCGNREVDRLVWTDDGEFVKCATCGQVYGSDGKPCDQVPDPNDNDELNGGQVTAKPGDLVTVLAEPVDSCPGALVGSTGTVLVVTPGPPSHMVVRWPDGGCSRLYDGIDRYEIKDMFVGCPACGTHDVFDLGQDPATGIVTCACGHDYNPKDFR